MSYKYNFPRIKFVDTNSIEEQLKHFLSEVEELKKEPVGSDAFYTEAMDCIHSLETLFRILGKDAPCSASRLQQSIIKKNIFRGYYPDGVFKIEEFLN